MYVRPGHKSGCIVRRGGLPSLRLSSPGLAQNEGLGPFDSAPKPGYAAQLFLVHVSASSPIAIARTVTVWF